MTKYSKNIVALVKERFMAIPANIHFSIGDYGDFSRDELIKEIDEGSRIGNEAIEMQVSFIRNMPKILGS